MEVTVSKHKGKVPGARKMSVSERADIKDRIKEREEDLSAKGARGSNERFYAIPLGVDRAAVVRETEVLNTKIHADDELISRNRQKDRDDSEAKKLREELRGVIPPHHLQNAKPGTPEYTKAVHAGEAALNPAITKKFERYQSLRRGLEPDNPHAGSVSEIID